MYLGMLGQFANQGQQCVLARWVSLLTKANSVSWHIGSVCKPRPTVCLGMLGQFANLGQQCVLVCWVSLLTLANSVSWYVGSVC